MDNREVANGGVPQSGSKGSPPNRRVRKNTLSRGPVRVTSIPWNPPRSTSASRTTAAARMLSARAGLMPGTARRRGTSYTGGRGS